MKAANKALLVKYARIGLEHAPKNTSKEEIENVRRVLAWTDNGITGNWDDTPSAKTTTPAKPKTNLKKGAGKKATTATSAVGVAGVEIDV